MTNRIIAWFRRRNCALGGHDRYLSWKAGRMFLRCASCGHETPGWRVEAEQERRRAALAAVTRKAS